MNPDETIKVIDWTLVIQAALVAAPLIIGQVGNFIISWRTSSKLDHNTKVTEEGKAEVKATLDENANKMDSALRESKAESKQEAIKVAATAISAVQKSTQNAEMLAGQTVEAVQEVAKAINGRMDEKLEIVRKASYAEGLLEGQKLTMMEIARVKAAEENLEKQVKMNTESIRRHSERDVQNHESIKKMLGDALTKKQQDQ